MDPDLRDRLLVAALMTLEVSARLLGYVLIGRAVLAALLTLTR